MKIKTKRALGGVAMLNKLSAEAFGKFWLVLGCTDYLRCHRRPALESPAFRRRLENKGFEP